MSAEIKEYLTMVVLLLGLFLLYSLFEKPLSGKLTYSSLFSSLFGSDVVGETDGVWVTGEYTIPSSNLQPGEVVGYRTRAQDSSGNWNSSETRYFVVQGGVFSVSNFYCNPTTSGYNCYIDYNNEMEEDVRVLFFTTDSSGRVVQSSVSPPLAPGLGDTFGVIVCTGLDTGGYKVSWWGYMESDASFSDPLAWSSNLVNINCD